MTGDTSVDQETAPGAGRFLTTHWSVVLRAQRGDSTRAHAALSALCRTYWYPLYVFVRRQGQGHEDARDLTQEFFHRLLADNFLDRVAREKGRFRSFLLAAMKHFLANQRDWARAAKRGGGQVLLSLDETDAEARYLREPADPLSADKIFERRWAMTLLEQVLRRLRQEFAHTGKSALYEQLRPCLTGAKETAPYAELGARLGMSEGAVKVAVHRLRQRYRELLREEIAQTVSGPAEVEAEIRHLFAVLGS